MRKIAIGGAVFSENWKGGEPRVAWRVYNYLRNKYECCIVPPIGMGLLRTYFRLLFSDSFLPIELYYMQYIKAFKPDVLLVFYDYDESLPLAAIKQHIPIVITQHIYWGICPKGSFYNSLYHNTCAEIPSGQRNCKQYFNASNKLAKIIPSFLWENIVNRRYELLRKAEKIIVPSSYMLSIYQRVLPEISRKLVVIHTGVDIRKFKPPHYIETGKEKRILFVGGRSIVKGFHHFLGIARLLKIKYPEAEFLVSGFGAGFNSKYVKNLGYLSEDELVRTYQNSLVVVAPYIWDDPCPQVPLEAMACGTPVIAYSVGGINEMIINQKTGYLVRRGDFKGLLEKVDFLLKNPDIALQMGKEARRYIENNFDARQMVRQYEDVLKSVTS